MKNKIWLRFLCMAISALGATACLELDSSYYGTYKSREGFTLEVGSGGITLSNVQALGLSNQVASESASGFEQVVSKLVEGKSGVFRLPLETAFAGVPKPNNEFWGIRESEEVEKSAGISLSTTESVAYVITQNRIQKQADPVPGRVTQSSGVVTALALAMIDHPNQPINELDVKIAVDLFVSINTLPGAEGAPIETLTLDPSLGAKIAHVHFIRVD